MRKYLLAIALLTPALAYSQQYSIDWYRIAGGGGTSTGAGVYSVMGTIAQPIASDWIGANGQSVLTGFWAIQTPAAPSLAMVAASTGQVTISWGPNMPGWILQERSSPTSGSWTNSPSGTTNPVTVATVDGAKFFRLVKP